MPFDPHRDLPTLEILSPPVLDYPYFKGEVPSGAEFELAATEYSPVNAWWLAEASLLAYGSADFVSDFFTGDTLLARAGMQFELIAGDDDTAGFVMFNERLAIVTFRGTRVLGLKDPLAFQASLAPHVRDLITDAQFLQDPFDQGRVHRGFAVAFQSVAARLSERLESLAADGRRVWFAGHSLGAALATLAAARFGVERMAGLYTYGCPRVGDAEFAAAFDGKPCFRVVHHEDLVARIPPPLVPGIPPQRYAHIGQLVYIDRDGSVSPSADPRRVIDLFEGRVDWQAMLASAGAQIREAAAILTGGLPASLGDLRFPRGAVSDHAPIYYASFLKSSSRREVAER